MERETIKSVLEKMEINVQDTGIEKFDELKSGGLDVNLDELLTNPVVRRWIKTVNVKKYCKKHQITTYTGSLHINNKIKKLNIPFVLDVLDEALQNKRKITSKINSLISK